MNGPESLPKWASDVLGAPRSTDQQFEDVLGAFTQYNNRPSMPTYEEVQAARHAARMQNPLHIKAVARRRKRKRGGPK